MKMENTIYAPAHPVIEVNLHQIFLEIHRTGLVQQFLHECAIPMPQMEDVSHFLRFYSQINAFMTANIVLIMCVRNVFHLLLKNMLAHL